MSLMLTCNVSWDGQQDYVRKISGTINRGYEKWAGLREGDELVFEAGYRKVRTFQSKSGETGAILEVDFQRLERVGQVAPAYQPPPPAPTQQAYAPQASGDDDIPF